MEIIRLPRRQGKTTKALEILRDNEKSVMFNHVGLRIDNPILEKNPSLKKRILTTFEFRNRLRGMVVDTVIIDNADLLDNRLLLDMLHHFTTFPLNLNGLCNIVMTITENEINEAEVDDLLKCRICSDTDHEGQFCRCESRNIRIAKQLRERGQSPWGDKVNHPKHYQGNGIEVIDIIEAFNLDFHLGNAIKYILRAGKKGDKKEDLEKASWYIARSISTELEGSKNERPNTN